MSLIIPQSNIIRPNETDEERMFREKAEFIKRKTEAFVRRCEQFKKEERIKKVGDDEILTTNCCICGREISYKTSSIPIFQKQKRWNNYRHQLDACFYDNTCEHYYKEWRDFQIESINFLSGKKKTDIKNDFNPAQIKRESKGLLI